MTLRTLVVVPLLTTLAVLLSPSLVDAQVRHPGQPAADRVFGVVPELVIPPPMHVAELMEEDAFNRAHSVPGPLRFGVLVELPVVFEDHASWEVSDDGELLVGRLKLTSPGAYSLGVEWARFDLPPEGRLFLYDEDLQTVFGAYTREERIPTGEFVVEPFPGDSVILEYQQPARAALDVHMVVRGVIYDYTDVFALERGLDQPNHPQSGDGSYSGGCNVDVNCPEGDPYPLHKRAVVRTVFGGGLCSASLINNVNSDGTRYVYSANHCGQGTTTVFRFNYQTAGCGTGGTGGNQSVTGATLLDNDVDTDGRLLRITNNIPDSYNPYYAGWSRSTSSLSFGMCMHHPGGNPKCIAIDSNGGGQVNVNFQGIGTVKCWSMNFQIGGTSGGSSGSPIFDQNGRIRGTLTGGPANCAISYYGRFHNFWNDDNLGEWLDPGGTGVTSIDGFDPFADLSAAALVFVSPNSGPLGGFDSVTLTGTGFDGVSSVQFDGVDALDFTVSGTSQITAEVPAGAGLGAVDVSVTDSFGTSTLAGAYTYTADPAPDIDTVSPNFGGTAGGKVVTISGNNVLGVTDVQFDGVSGTGLSIDSATSLTVSTPAAADAGPVDVVVLGNGSDTLVDGFLYQFVGEFVLGGPGHPGSNGLSPALSGIGDPTPFAAPFSLITTSVAPNAIGVVFVSLSEASLPFKGGLLYPVPILATIDIQASFLGIVVLGGLTIDPAIPGGTLIVLQEAFADAGASNGVSLSNGYKILTGGS